METTEKHIIHRLNVDVDVPDMATARYIHDHVAHFLYEEVLPQVEKICNNPGYTDGYFRTDKMDIDLEFQSQEDFIHRFATVVTGAIQKQLQHKTNNPLQANDMTKELFTVKTEPQKRQELFLHFLQTGTLPWYASTEINWLQEEALLADIEQEPVLTTQLLNILYQDAVVRKRLLSQFTIPFIVKILTSFYIQSNQHEPPISLKERLQRLAPAKQLSFLEEVLDWIGAKKELPDTLEIEIMQWTETVVPPETATTATTNDIENQQEDAGIYLSHAGLILLHPFLLYFFRQLKLLNVDQFADDAACQTAIHLLCYLATGKEQPYEYELSMEKYLCNWPLQKPVERFIELPPAMKEEAEQLLKAVIHHWKILKTSSPDSLREAFLQRNGKLLFTGQHRLLVESSSIDMLLDHLPWNYSVILLPWMKQLLYVDWKTN